MSTTDERARHVATLRKISGRLILTREEGEIIQDIATWIERTGEDEARALREAWEDGIEAERNFFIRSAADREAVWKDSQTYARLHSKPDEATP